VIEYLPGSQMYADVLMKNLQGPLFERHSKHYVRDVESKEAESQQAGEAAGMKKNGASEDLNHLEMKRKTGSVMYTCCPSATQLMATKAQIVVVRKMERWA
jgi:hypothetical protein